MNNNRLDKKLSKESGDGRQGGGDLSSNDQSHKRIGKHRGGVNKKRTQVVDSFTIFFQNIRGIKSKEYSLKKLIKRIKPDVVALNETQLCGSTKVDIKPYTWWMKNRSKKGGGVATGVAQEYKDKAIGAGEGSEKDEYLITRIDAFSPALNIVNCYGEQRSNKLEVIEEKWTRIVNDMEEIRNRGEYCLLVGDLNKLVGSDDLGVPGNHSEVSPGGRLLRTLLASKEWTLVNGMGENVVEGGPFTGKDPATAKESCLDLFIVSENLRPHVAKLVIDAKREMTTARAIKKKGGFKLVLSLIHI